MLNDSFKSRYGTTPFAVYVQSGEMRPTQLHNHSEFEILYIIKGTFRITVSGQPLSAKAGDLIFVNPFEVHEVIPDSSTPCSHSCVCFDVSLIGATQIADGMRNETLHIRHLLPADHPLQSFLCTCYEGAFRAHEEASAFSDVEIRAYLTLLMTELMKHHWVETGTGLSRQNQFCKDVLSFIEQHYSEPITSRQVADALSYNQSYFCRQFRMQFNQRFSEYLNMYRIAAARSLLEDPAKTIGEISEQCGFSAHSWFTRCFFRQTGMLPTDYRAKKSIQ